MKRLLTLGMLGVASAGSAALVPIFINDSPLTLPDAGLPVINTVAFVNRSSITVSPFTISVGVGIGGFGFNTAATLPFETFNTLYYTNEATAVMSGSPGFRFLTTQGRVRRPARVFVNEGEISTGSYLEVRADTVISTGPLDTSEAGLIRLTGRSADLTRTRVRSGGFAGSIFIGGGQNNSPRRNQYINAVGVTDSYWGVGSNGVFLGSGPPTRFTAMNLNLPSPSSPLHQNEFLSGRRLATNRVSLPKFNFFGTNFSLTNFAAFVYNSTVDGTAAMVQVVFVRTNGPDANFSANVTFSPFAFEAEIAGPAQPMVELKKWDFDPTLDLYITNSFYLSDSMAILTNLNLYRNVGVGARGRRPNVYEFQLSPTFNWPGVPGNSTFTNGLLDTGYLSNRVNMAYAGYSATVFTNALSGLNTTFGLLPNSINPTNQLGRVEIVADQLNLDSTRVRAESTALFRTKDLLGNKLARLVDAPLVGVDLTSRQPELVISNLAPPTVQRLSGMVCAWSGLWKNYQIDPVTMETNEINFHVLFVDHSLQPTVPVQVFQFVAHATNLVIADQINLFPVTQIGLTAFASDPIRGRKFLIDAQSLDVRSGLSLPVGASWARTNVQRLVNFTNRGNIFVPGAGKYGTDRPEPYNHIINSGTNTAASQLVRTRNFENSGCFMASSALVQIDAATARIEGPPIASATNISPLLTFTNIGGTNFFFVTNGFTTNIVFSSFGAKVQSFTDLQISAGSLSVSNSLLAAGAFDQSFSPGRLLMSVTNSLVDAGVDAFNLWSCSGFEMRRRPAISSLLGTRLDTTIPINLLKTHIWSAQDLGAVAEGYTNNLALGILGINISTNNGRALFRSASGRQAMYVDYLDLFNDATNFNRTIAISNNFTIYFANASVPVSKLDGALNGRFRWVPSFIGPFSSTNITYPSGNTYTFNVALVQSRDIDSDGDGIPNADDPTPIYVPEDAVLAVELNTKLLQPRAMLSWNALAYSTNTIEFKDATSATQWRVLTNYVHGPFTSPVQVYDPITSDSATRLYRLRVSPAPTP